MKQTTEKIYPSLLDTKTGELIIATEMTSSLFWWADGNGSCDCNRAILFNKEQEVHKELAIDENHCLGHTRFIVVDVHGDFADLKITKQQAIEEMNGCYPQELLNEFRGFLK